MWDLVVSLAVLAAFGPGFQGVAVFLPLLFGVFLSFVRREPLRRWPVAYLALAVGSWIAYLGIFNSDAFDAESVFTVLAISLVLSLFFFVPAFADWVFLARFRTAKTHWRALVYPLAWAGTWTFINSINPTGSWANHAYVLVSQPHLFQLLSIAGLPGPIFVVAWAAAIGVDNIADLYERSSRVSSSSPSSAAARNNKSTSDTSFYAVEIESLLKDDAVSSRYDACISEDNNEKKADGNNNGNLYPQVSGEASSYSFTSSSVAGANAPGHVDNTSAASNADNSAMLSSPSSASASGANANVEASTNAKSNADSKPLQLVAGEFYACMSTLGVFLSNPTGLFFFVLLLVYLHGALRENVFRDNRFFQTSTNSRIPAKLQASCLISSEALTTGPILNKTATEAADGAQIILWSETAVVVDDASAADRLISDAGVIAKQYGTFIGVTYSENLPNSENTANMFVLINADGEAVIKYQKSHPVIFVEDDVEPGPKTLQTATGPTGFDRVSGAICFDFDFPYFISQAAQKNVDLMLQPSWTWGPIGQVHSTMAQARAIENGFTLFRCSSGGVSGVYDAFGLRAWTEQGKVGSYRFELNAASRVWTLYGLWGDTFGWVCFSLTVIVYIVSLAPVRFVHPLVNRRLLPPLNANRP